MESCLYVLHHMSHHAVLCFVSSPMCLPHVIVCRYIRMLCRKIKDAVASSLAEICLSFSYLLLSLNPFFMG